jgi:DNA-binding winged helix-turn-helix (wHTH) protein/tetratricopeptide (TPR) repeat protein
VQTHPGTVYRFGPFEVNAASGELVKNGRPIRLQEQPYRLLLVLLETPGEAVSREELRSRLWPGDTFVDFDGSLRVAVRKLRDALDDNAEDPRYIETIPKHGYRFLVPEVRRTDAAPEIAEPNGNRGPLQTDATPVATRLKSNHLFRYAIAASTLIVTAASVFLWHQREQAKPLTNKDVLVLADFTNTTGDPVFDGTLRQGLTVQLEQSPFLHLVTEERIRQVLRMMGQSEDARLTPAIAQEVCERTAGAAVLNGSIASLGSQYVLGLRAVDCRNGGVLDAEQAQATRKEDVLNALSQIASRFRTRVGESLATVERYDTPLIDATTPSLEALKAYSLGRKRHATGGDTAARPYFKRAVELEPNFAMAYAYLSTTYGNHREPELAAENIRKAYDLRAKVGERERFYIESHYYEYGTGELEKAVLVFEQWQQTYPGYYSPYTTLGYMYRMMLGNPEKALEEAREAMRLAPNSALSHYNLGADYVVLNRLDEAEAVFKQAKERELENDELPKSRYTLAFLRGDTAGMAQAASAASGKPGKEDFMLAALADTEAWYGRLKDAHELNRRAMDSALHNSGKEAAAYHQVNGALLEAASGNLKLARADVDAALKLAPDRNVREAAALAIAQAGDTTAAEKLAAALDTDFPLDTLVQRYWLPAIRAAIALQRKDPGRAVELLQVTNALELGDSRMIVVHLRGEAYLMLHDGSHAAAEFQKFVDHRTLVANAEWGALARLGLARAYAMQGDTAKARVAYQDFLTLWKDADADIPVLRQANAEYGKLQ